jgi:uncharacterized protein (DUF885 family)
MKRILTAAALGGVVSWTAMAVAAKPTDWVEVSNGYTKRLMAIEMKYAPETGSAEGLVEYDTLIAQPTLANEDAERNETTALIAEFKEAIPQQKYREVGRDLELLVNKVEMRLRADDYGRRHKVPYLNPSAMVYAGVRMLLNDETAMARQQAAVARIRKYAGLDEGYQPLTEILKQRVVEQMARPEVVYPTRTQIVTEIGRNSTYIEAIAELLTNEELKDWQQPMAVLATQLAEYDEWMMRLVLPKARTDFRLPDEEYALNLQKFGIDVAPDRLIADGHRAFAEIQNEMKPLAEQIAKQRGLPSTDYRDVIRDLKKEQVIGNATLVLYQDRLRRIQNLTKNRGILTVPRHSGRMRLATAVETALEPAPHVVPPPFLNNTAGRGEFVLPLAAIAGYDDFTFDAASWTLIAHDAIPGQQLQFESMLEQGTSLARVKYAFNSTNFEGWGLYAASLIMPDMPPEGQLMSLDQRLLGAARMFLDPELQIGTIQPADAHRVLEQDVVVSQALAKQEVERYTYGAPGQGASHYYGFSKLLTLRKETEASLGRKFNQARFHDFILAQGFLTSDEMRRAVTEEFVNQQLK